MNKNKLYRLLSMLLLTTLSVVLLVGCAAKLPEGFDEAEVKASAENVISMLGQADSDGLKALMTDEMNAALTEDVMAQIFAMVAAAGPFQEISEMRTGGSTQNEITYAVVVAKSKYEKSEITYTISFDSDMKLAGLFLK